MSRLDFCRGFLEAMQNLNSESSDIYAYFLLEILPPADELQSALMLRCAQDRRSKIDPSWTLPYPHWYLPLEKWSVKTRSLAKLENETLQSLCHKWFFYSEHMKTTPDGLHRTNPVDIFLSSLRLALGTHSVHVVESNPPIVAGDDWDDVVFETDTERYLLHFSSSD